MTVKELNEEQLEQLKMKLFYDFDSADDFLLAYLADELSCEEYKILETANCWTDIPNDLIYKLFDGLYFVEEDFCKGDDEDEN